MAVVAAVVVEILRHLRQPCLVVVAAAAHRALIACIKPLHLVPLNPTALPLLAHLERLAQALAAAMAGRAAIARLAAM